LKPLIGKLERLDSNQKRLVIEQDSLDSINL
jgi:hypothetical protein